jgi:hypothetical protein
MKFQLDSSKPRIFPALLLDPTAESFLLGLFRKTLVNSKPRSWSDVKTFDESA